MIRTYDEKVIKDSKLTNLMIDINDDQMMKWSEKESKLIPLFKQAGIKLSFKGPKKDKSA